MAVVDESIVVSDEPSTGTQIATNTQSSEASSTSSTAEPVRQIFGRSSAGVVYDPALYPSNNQAPQTMVVEMDKFCNAKLAEVKIALRNFISKSATFRATKDHIEADTFPHDLRHEYSTLVQYPHSIPKEVRDQAANDDHAAFRLFKRGRLEARLPIYEMDMLNAKKILADLKNRDLLQTEFFQSTSSHFSQFMPCVNYHLISYLGVVDKLEKTAFANQFLAAQKLAAAKEASLAKHAAKVAAEANGTIAEVFHATTEARLADIAVSSAEHNTQSMAWLETRLPELFNSFKSFMLAQEREHLLLKLGVPKPPAALLDGDYPNSRFSANHKKPPAAAAAAAGAAAANEPSSRKTFAAAATSAAAAAAASTRTNTTSNAPNSRKSPKNSSGSGGRPTAHERGQGQRPDNRPYQDHRRQYHQYHDDRYQYHPSGSHPSSRSDSSLPKRPPSPSLDRADTRSNSRPRYSDWPPPRHRSPVHGDRGAGTGHGNRHPQSSSRRDSRDRDYEPYRR